MRHDPMRWVRGLVGNALGAGTLALAWATAVGIVLEGFRPGSAVHPLWMGSTGAAAVDFAMAGAFAALVLLVGKLAGRWPRATIALRRVVGGAVSTLAAVALVRHAGALADGRLLAAGFAPPSTLVALLFVVPWTFSRPTARPATLMRRLLPRTASVTAAGLVLVFAQISAVGATDYRTPADAIVALGAKVNPDGRPSWALEERTRTACALWQEGLAPVLVFSGGRAKEAPVSEPAAMREIARGAGIPDGSTLLDESGLDTEASVRFVADLARARGWRRVIVVSHDYHLARVRLLAAREGLAVRTVPATETHPSGWKTKAVAREVAAYLAEWALPSR